MQIVQSYKHIVLTRYIVHQLVRGPVYK